MLGKTFSPRIRDVKNQRIYRIDKERDHGYLTPLISSHDRLINLNWIEDQWDRIGHFLVI
jgi:TnpA family transposase